MAQLYYFSGLISGILVSLYGSHVTAVVGSVVMTVGMVTSGLVSSPYLLYLTYGVIAGTHTRIPSWILGQVRQKHQSDAQEDL